MDTTANRIREALELRNMKQIDLIKKTGINKSALSSYISGKYIPKQNNIYLMAKALNVDEAWLMGKDVPIERHEYSETTTPPLRQDEEQFLDLYNQLDQEDRAELRGTAKGMLKSDKYKRKDTASKLA